MQFSVLFCCSQISLLKYSKNDNVSQFGFRVSTRKAAMENGQDGVNGTSPLMYQSATR